MTDTGPSTAKGAHSFGAGSPNLAALTCDGQAGRSLAVWLLAREVGHAGNGVSRNPGQLGEPDGRGWRGLA